MICDDTLRLGDDFGDNECSFACMLEAGHEGPHRDEFEGEGRMITITWSREETKDVSQRIRKSTS